jgi:hypothetical protein
MGHHDFPVAADSGRGEMEEMNDRTGAADKCDRQNNGDNDKKCDFGEKAAPRFGTEIFATDVEERRLGAAGGTAGIAIEREDLKIAF